jgi:G3E family GTPase
MIDGQISNLIPVTVLWGDPRLVDSLLDRNGDPQQQILGRANSHRPGPNVARPAITGSRTPGCRCCQSRLDLVDAIRTLVERPAPPTHLIVALSNSDDPLVAVRTLLAEPDLAAIVDLDAVVATVSATSLATRIATDQSLKDGYLLDALAIADRVIVADAGLVTADARSAVTEVLGGITQVGTIMCREELVRPATELLGAWHGIPPVANGGEYLVPPDGIPGTLRCTLPGSVDPLQFERWLDATIATYGSRLCRVQGVVQVHSHREPICLRGALSYASTHSGHGGTNHPAWQGSTFVIVGYELDHADLAHGFHATAQH